MKEEFELQKTIEKIDDWSKFKFETNDNEFKKVFYNPFEGEWGFWKFHIKAIKNGDWRSIISWWKI